MSDFNDNDIDVTALSSTEMAARVELLKVEAKMTLQMKKNGAAADNQDVDIAQVCFKNMSEGTKPIVIDYKIESGTAVFLENKQKTLRKHTNNSLSSTVQLINGTPGKGMLKATPYLNPKMAPPPVEYEFVGPARKLKLVLDVTTDNQLADGTGIDVVTATLIDETTNKPVSNEKLDFELSTTDAQFQGGGTKIQATTDADGKILVRITSNANANISVTLTATVVTDPSVSQKVVVNFKAKLWKLVLTVNPNGQHSDGVAADVVIATLTDQNNKPLSNVKINFVLSDNIAKFTSGGTSAIVATDAKGKATVRITSNANANVSLTVTATVVDDTSITQSIDIYFTAKPKTPPVTPKPPVPSVPKVSSFCLQGIVTNAVAYNQSACLVRAYLVLEPGSPVTPYYVRFTHKSSDVVSDFYIWFPENGESLAEWKYKSDKERKEKIKLLQTAGSGTSVYGTTDVSVYSAGFTNVWAEIRAELLDMNYNHVAYSLPSSNPTVRFSAHHPSALATRSLAGSPASSSGNYELNIASVVDNTKTKHSGTGNIAAVRLTQNGRPVANAQVNCSFSGSTGNYCGFANDANQRQQQVTSQSGTASPNIVMRTNGNGEFSVTMALWSRVAYGTREHGTLRVTYNGASASRQFNWIP